MPTRIYRRLSIEELTGSVQPVDRFDLDPVTYKSRSRLRGNICEALCCQQPYVCRSEEHTSELQSLMRISYAVFCLKKKSKHTKNLQIQHNSPHTVKETHTAKKTQHL